MTITPFRRVRSSDDVIQQLQDAINLPLQDISAKTILDGQLLKDVILKTGSVNTINHKLGRNLVGYIVTMQDAQSNLWSTQASNKLPNLTLYLSCSADVTLSLWVF